MTGRSAMDARRALPVAAALTAGVAGSAVAFAVSAYVAGPLLLPGVVLAAVLAVLVLRDPALGLAGSMLAIAAEVLGLPTGPVSPAEAGIALVGAGYLARLALAPGTVLPPTWRDLPLALLIGAIAAGLLVAVDPGPTLRVTVLWGLFACAFLQARQLTPAQVRRVLVWAAVAAGVLGVVGTYSYATASGPRLYGGGQATGTRAVGAFGDANYFASLLTLVVVPGLALVLAEPKRRLWLLAPLALGVAGILFSLSRGGVLGLGTGLLVLLVWRRARRVAFGVLVVVGLLTALNLNPLVRSQQLQVVGTRLSTISEQGQTSLRPRIWEAAAAAAVDSPLVGVGWGNFRYVASARGVTEGGSPLENAHSIPFSLAAETGFVGLLAFAAFVLVLLRDALVAGRRRLGSARTQALRVGVGAGLAGFLLQGLTVVQLRVQVVAGAFFVVCGLLAALSRPDADPPVRHPSGGDRNSWSRPYSGV